MRVPFFRIFYSTTFTILSLILLALLLVTPADCIYQAYKYDQLFNVFIIAGVYLLVAIIAILIYATRRYTIKSHLASIPKSWIPIEHGDVPMRVRKMIKDAFAESASIAFEAHPRAVQPNRQTEGAGTTGAKIGDEGPAQLHSSELPEQHATPPRWGIISHPGWSSPASPDLPYLQYDNVIQELPHLIEAKAVSLAPADPLYIQDANTTSSANLEPPLPDALAVELLQRPATMGLRDYFGHLTTLGMINPPSLGITFLDLYEKARFSGEALNERDFRNLMSMFASILCDLRELDPILLAKLHSDDESSGSEIQIENDTDSIMTADTVEHNTNTPSFHTPFHSPMPDVGYFADTRPPLLHNEASDGSGSLAGSEGTIRTTRSRHHRPSRSGRNKGKGKRRETERDTSRETRSTTRGSFGWRSAKSTAASHQWSREGKVEQKGEPEAEGKEEAREVQASSPNSLNLRYVGTNPFDAGIRSSSSQSNLSRGSVIRLAEARATLDLPYAFVVDEGRERR